MRRYASTCQIIFWCPATALHNLNGAFPTDSLFWFLQMITGFARSGAAACHLSQCHVAIEASVRLVQGSMHQSALYRDRCISPPCTGIDASVRPVQGSRHQSAQYRDRGIMPSCKGSRHQAALYRDRGIRPPCTGIEASGRPVQGSRHQSALYRDRGIRPPCTGIEASGRPCNVYNQER